MKDVYKLKKENLFNLRSGLKGKEDVLINKVKIQSQIITQLNDVN